MFGRGPTTLNGCNAMAYVRCNIGILWGLAQVLCKIGCLAALDKR